jgi:hypothetical protein
MTRILMILGALVVSNLMTTETKAVGLPITSSVFRRWSPSCRFGSSSKTMAIHSQTPTSWGSLKTREASSSSMGSMTKSKYSRHL